MLLIRNKDLVKTFLPLVLPNVLQPNNFSQEFSDRNKETLEQDKSLSENSQAENSSHIDPNEFLEEKNNIIKAAYQEAEHIIAEAQKRAVSIEKSAYEQGLGQAKIDAANELVIALEENRNQLSQALEELAILREQISSYMEQELVNLSIEIAKKVVHQEVTTQRDVVVSLIQASLAKLQNRVIAQIRVHPDDYEYLVENTEKIATGKTFDLISDKSINRGGCLVETEFGVIDGRIEQQFAEIERGFSDL